MGNTNDTAKSFNITCSGMFCTIKGNQEDWKKFRDGADQGDDDIILAWWLGAALLLILAILFAIWLYLKSKKGQAGDDAERHEMEDTPAVKAEDKPDTKVDELVLVVVADIPDANPAAESEPMPTLATGKEALAKPDAESEPQAESVPEEPQSKAEDKSDE